MCGGWITALKPTPYQLVAIRELVLSPVTNIDLVHVGYWNGLGWFALSPEKVDGTKLPKGNFTGIGIVNIYGWRHFNGMIPNER